MFEKIFYKSDVLYSNGIVNMFGFLDKFDYINRELTNEYLHISFEREENEVFEEIYKEFLKEYNIVFFTKNDRFYWDERKSDFKIAKRMDIVGKTSGNDVKYTYIKTTPAKLGYSSEEFHDIFLDFVDKNNLPDNLKKEFEKDFYKNGAFKRPESIEIPVYTTLNKLIESFMEYSCSDDYLKMDSKIHQFEDGSSRFRDFVNKPDDTINKWDALIYWFGVRIFRFYSGSFYVYLNSPDLLDLQEIKKNLAIGNDNRKIENKKGEEVEILSNIDFYNQLNKDGIRSSTFYISNAEIEFELKLMMFIFSYIYHIEDNYENSTKKGSIFEKLFDKIKSCSFVSYREDGNLKSSLSEYTRVSRLFDLFRILREKKIVLKKKDKNGGETKETLSLFAYLGSIITSVSQSSRDSKKDTSNITSFCTNFMNFNTLRKNYFETCLSSLKYDKPGINKGLFEFECEYLKFIDEEEFVLKIHDISKKIGDGIGILAVEIESKDLLFKLRNIKNYRQFVGYFKDMNFTILKESDNVRITSEFKNALEGLLENLSNNDENWEIAKDYIAIYAITKYRSANYAKNIKDSKGDE